jgi:hypothetical protein
MLRSRFAQAAGFSLACVLLERDIRRRNQTAHCQGSTETETLPSSSSLKSSPPLAKSTHSQRHVGNGCGSQHISQRTPDTMVASKVFEWYRVGLYNFCLRCSTVASVPMSEGKNDLLCSSSSQFSTRATSASTRCFKRFVLGQVCMMSRSSRCSEAHQHEAVATACEILNDQSATLNA